MTPLDSLKSQLTARHLQTWSMLALGCTNVEIGRALGLSTKTVDNHRVALYQRLGVDNVADATRKAIAFGVIGVPTVEMDSVADASIAL